jgi:hypothetical protein
MSFYAIRYNFHQTSSGNRTPRSSRKEPGSDLSTIFEATTGIGWAPVTTMGLLGGALWSDPRMLLVIPVSNLPMKGILSCLCIACLSSPTLSLTARLIVLGARYPIFPSGMLSPWTT